MEGLDLALSAGGVELVSADLEVLLLLAAVLEDDLDCVAGVSRCADWDSRIDSLYALVLDALVVAEEGRLHVLFGDGEELACDAAGG